MLRKIYHVLRAAGWVLLLFPLLVAFRAVFPEIQMHYITGVAACLVGVVGLSLLLTAWRLRRTISRAPSVGSRFIRRSGANYRDFVLALYEGPVPDETVHLQEDGHCVIRNVFTTEEIEALKRECLRVFDEYPPDDRPLCATKEGGRMYRYEMFNRSPLCQCAMEHRRILDVIEPLLGDDCHVIANTAWRNPVGQKGVPFDTYWHTDAGPHVPRLPHSEWPEGIPYPIFVISAHIYLEDCGIDDGPTGVIPGSHKSGQSPPVGDQWNPSLSYQGRVGVAHIVQAGDVGMFVSDAWHRRLPPNEKKGKGRFFLQICYGRRDIAQRVALSAVKNLVGMEATARAVTPRQKQLLGIHPPGFYDS